jgi:hypothetical protein
MMTTKRALRLKLSFFCVLSAWFVCSAALCIGGTIDISPYRIILSGDTCSEDVHAKVPMVLISGDLITDFEASLQIEGCSEIIASATFYYCPYDDMLHIYFDKDEVLNCLEDNEIEGQVTVFVWGRFLNGTDLVGFSGSDVVEVLVPESLSKGPN